MEGGEAGRRGQGLISGEISFLLTHSAIYGLGTVVAQLVAFLLLPLYTRYLTPADYGTLETIDVSSGILGVVVTMGVLGGFSRFYYEPQEERGRRLVVSTAYLTYAVCALVSLPLLLRLADPLAGLLLDSRHYGAFFRIGFLSLLAGFFTDIGMLYLRLTKRPAIFISVTLTRLLMLVALNVLFVVKYGQGVRGVLLSSLVANSIYGFGLTAAVLAKSGLGFSLRLSGQMLRFALPVIPSNLGNIVVKQSDKYFILHFISVADMGIYSLALKLGNCVHNLLTIPFNMAWMPRRFEVMRKDDAPLIYSRIFTYYVFMVGMIGLAISVLIPEILHFMVTPRFARAGEIVPLVVLSMVIYGTHFHFDFGILQSMKTKYLSYIGVVSAGVQVGLNWLLISRFGFMGAVWSSILSLGLQAALLWAVSRRLYPIPYEFGRVVRFSLLAVGFYLVASRVRTPVLALDVGLKLLLLAAFLAVLVLMGVITREETGRLRRLLRPGPRPQLALGGTEEREG